MLAYRPRTILSGPRTLSYGLGMVLLGLRSVNLLTEDLGCSDNVIRTEDTSIHTQTLMYGLRSQLGWR